MTQEHQKAAESDWKRCTAMKRLWTVTKVEWTTLRVFCGQIEANRASQEQWEVLLRPRDEDGRKAEAWEQPSGLGFVRKGKEAG